MKRKTIYVFGERNCGTNYLEKLILKNFKEINLSKTTSPIFLQIIKKYLHSNIGENLIDFYFETVNHRFWKHTTLRKRLWDNIDDNIDSVITISKNPYSWLLSLYKNHYHIFLPKGITFQEFLDFKIIPRHRDYIGKKQVSPIEMWNIKNASYFEYNGKRIINIRYEDLLADFDEVLNRIGMYMYGSSYNKRHTNYIDPAKRDNTKDHKYYRDYYLNKDWLRNYDKSSLDNISSKLDINLMKKLQYEFEV